MTILFLKYSILPYKIPCSSISLGCEQSFAIFREEILGTSGIIENWVAHFETISCENLPWSLVLSTMENLINNKGKSWTNHSNKKEKKKEDKI